MQTTNNILLVRPTNFAFNIETAASNVFQQKGDESEDATKQKVICEFELFTTTLQSKGVNVFVMDDTVYPEKPDAIFPNNWVSFHPDGTVILYPMYAANRRHERRQDILDTLKKDFEIKQLLDLSNYENEGMFLEGTGSIVFDHRHKIAYACLSPRTNKELFVKVCQHLQYKPIWFLAYDNGGMEIYHTNVMMCVGERFAVICIDSISNNQEREFVLQSLKESGHQVIDITWEQMNHFAGNMLALQTNEGKSIVAISQSAFDSLTQSQKTEIGKYGELVPLSVNTIETIGGGSVRCMIAEVFLKPIVY